MHPLHVCLQVEAVAALHHPNLVRLIGYCAEVVPETSFTEQIVVYEFVPNGDLKHFMDQRENKPFLCLEHFMENIGTSGSVLAGCVFSALFACRKGHWQGLVPFHPPPPWYCLGVPGWDPQSVRAAASSTCTEFWSPKVTLLSGIWIVFQQTRAPAWLLAWWSSS